MFKSVSMCLSMRSLAMMGPNSWSTAASVITIGQRKHLSSSSSADGTDKSGDQSVSNEILADMKKPQMTDSTSDATSNDNMTVNEPTDQLSFAKAFEKFAKLSKDGVTAAKVAKQEPSVPFPTLMRHSAFVQMGDPVGKVVMGRIDDVIDDDLYIDFGFKFNGVCRRPKSNQSEYVRGAKVKVRINDLELSDRFLGSSQDMTLLEADITLMGIVWSPNNSAADQRSGKAIDI